MLDYGHPLRFATFISPANSPAHRPVELAQHSERLGFDFVTFQDHPYQSSFLDTWTLLSWVAARTERIGVSANVLNLPLRQPPAVLARAAASPAPLRGGRGPAPPTPPPPSPPSPRTSSPGNHGPRSPPRRASASPPWPAPPGRCATAPPPKQSPPYANTSPADANSTRARCGIA